MTSIGSFDRLLEYAEADLWTAFKAASEFAQMGDRGSVRERALERFLSERLPNRFTVAQGEAIDYLGNQSGQIDILIYDSSTTSPLYREEDGRVLLPAEALLATIEVKSKLTATEAKLAVMGASKVHTLRPWAAAWLPERVKGKSATDRRPRVLTTVFAYETDLAEERWATKETERVRVQAEAADTPVENLNRLVVLNRGLLIPAQGRAGEPGRERGVLALWYFSLVSFLAREVDRRPPFPWDQYHIAGKNSWKSAARPVERAIVASPPTNAQRRRARTRAVQKASKGK